MAIVHETVPSAIQLPSLDQQKPTPILTQTKTGPILDLVAGVITIGSAILGIIAVIALFLQDGSAALWTGVAAFVAFSIAVGIVRRPSIGGA